MALKRDSAIVKRLSRMQLPPEEKALMIRMGETIDAAINNRAPTNPFDLKGRNKRDRRLPTPRNFAAKPGIRSVKLEWDAIDSSILHSYKIVITNLDTGVSEEKVSFTNFLIYNGRIGGSYKATVQAIGRNNTTTLIQAVEFFVADNVMLLEGAKNGYNTISDIVSEDITLLKGHKIFIWASFSIDRLIAGATTGNTQAAVQLFKGPKGGTIDDATLIEQITLYAASETATNLDTTALGGGILRPSESILRVRGTTFETSQSVMFTPWEVPTDSINTGAIFYVKVLGREEENDVTSLSITLWSAFEGASSQIPSDPFEREPAIVIPDLWSIDFDSGANDEWIHGWIPANRRMLGAAWTVGMWAWPRTLNGDTINVSAVPISRGSVISGENTEKNSFRFSWFASQQVTNPGPHHRIIINVSGGDGTGKSFKIGHPTTGDQDLDSPSELFKQGTQSWYFIVITFVNGVGVKLYINGDEKLLGDPGVITNPLGFSSNSTDSVDLTMDLRHKQAWIIGGEIENIYDNDGFSGDDIELSTNRLNGRIHSAGAWNTVLTQDEITELYGNGKVNDSSDSGAIQNWRVNRGEYASAGNLIHWWQLGAIRSATKWVGRDTGLNAWAGDVDLTNPADFEREDGTTENGNQYSDGIEIEPESQSDIVNNFPGE